MTDFIHEHPKEGPSDPAPLRDEPELDERVGQQRVYGYIFILFIVAFSLLMWSFLMNQRGTDQVLSELRGNASAMQTTMERNIELERQLDALTEEKEALEQSVAKQREIVDMLNEQTGSLSVNRDLCYALLLMSDGDHQGAAAMLASWYSTSDFLKEIEANDTGSWNDSAPPILLRERYDTMVEQLVMEGYLTVEEDGRLKSWQIDTSH